MANLKPGQREWRKGTEGAGMEKGEVHLGCDGEPHTVVGSRVGRHVGQGSKEFLE